MTLCFLKALANSKNGSISQQEYISHLLAHLRGTRHSDDSIPSTIEPVASFEPWAAALRDLALETTYEPLEDTSLYEALFIDCLEGRANKFKSELRALRKRSTQPDPLQPAACLAAQKKHLSILQFCLDEGAVFDRYLTRAAQLGARGNTPFLEFLLACNWANIQHPEAVQEQIKYFGDDSVEADWLRQHAGKGLTAEATTNKYASKRKEKQLNNKSINDPRQGFTPEQIQGWFGDVRW